MLICPCYLCIENLKSKTKTSVENTESDGERKTKDEMSGINQAGNNKRRQEQKSTIQPTRPASQNSRLLLNNIIKAHPIHAEVISISIPYKV